MFEINNIYNRRRDIHEKFGGNPQSGISNCAYFPYIFIFTGQSGKQHGYEDGWDENNYFHYSGEGQNGDMTFSRGNRAILEHQQQGKLIFLFKNEGNGLYRFIDQLELVDYDFPEIIDTSGQIRMGIEFIFKSAEEKSYTPAGKPRSAKDYNKPDKTEREGLVISRVGQGWYRNYLLHKWDYRCAVTNVDIKKILIASHIHSWKESTDKERLDIENGIILSPNLDALFDKHLISFENDKRIIFSDTISEKDLQILGVSTKMKLRDISEGMFVYLEKHRAKLYEIN